MADDIESLEIFTDRTSFERLLFQSRALSRLIDDAISSGKLKHLAGLCRDDSNLEAGDITALSWMLKENVDRLYDAVFDSGIEEPTKC